MPLKKFQLHNPESNPRPLLLSQCLNQLRFRLPAFSSCSVYQRKLWFINRFRRAFHSVLWCVMRSVCSHSAARFVRMLPQIVRHSPCFIREFLFMYTRRMYLRWGSRTPHTGHFYYKSIAQRESRREHRSERRVIIQSSRSEGVRLEIGVEWIFSFWC
jgi:hypothetical protein